MLSDGLAMSCSVICGCTSGFRISLIHGSNDLIRRDMSLCAGADVEPGVGALSHSKMAIHTSFFSVCAFRIMFFMIFTADSAFPFDL